MMRRMLMAAMVVSLLATGAQAIVVKNVTQGTVIFSDGYEGGTVGSPIILTEPSVGTWDPIVQSITDPYADPYPVVPVDISNQCLVDDVTSNGFAAWAGNQYVEVRAGVPRPVLTAILSPAPQMGDKIRVELAFRAVTEYCMVGLYGDAGGSGDTGTARLGSITSAAVIGANDLGWGTGYAPGDVRFCNSAVTDTQPQDINAWNTMVIEYVNGANTATLSINGAAPVVKQIPGPYSYHSLVYNIGPGIVTGVSLGSLSNGSLFYVDAGLPSVPVTGTVVLGGYTGADLSFVGLRVELRPAPSGTVRTDNVLLAADGKFTVGSVEQGVYDIAVKSYGHLQKVLTGITVVSPTDVGTISLYGGDCDGNNEITSTDLSIVLANMDMVGNL